MRQKLWPFSFYESKLFNGTRASTVYFVCKTKMLYFSQPRIFSSCLKNKFCFFLFCSRHLICTQNIWLCCDYNSIVLILNWKLLKLIVIQIQRECASTPIETMKMKIKSLRSSYENCCTVVRICDIMSFLAFESVYFPF